MQQITHDLTKVHKGWLVGWLVGFYPISTFVRYLMPNPVYAYIKYIWFVNNHIVGNILNKSKLVCSQCSRGHFCFMGCPDL